MPPAILSANSIVGLIQGLNPAPRQNRRGPFQITLPTEPQTFWTNALVESITRLQEYPQITVIPPLERLNIAATLDFPVLVGSAIDSHLNIPDQGPGTPAWMMNEDPRMTYRHFVMARATAIKTPRQDLDPEAYAFEVEQQMASLNDWQERWRLFIDDTVQRLGQVNRRGGAILVVSFTDLDPILVNAVLNGIRGLGHQNVAFVIDAVGVVPEARQAQVRVQVNQPPPQPPRPRDAFDQLLDDD